MGLQGQSWYMDLIRQIFAFLDKLVYGLIKWILFGIFDLSHLTTNSEIFSGIYSRIYVILGIFMAFKLAFSFFQYIIDPESMTGKGEKTISKLFMRVFIMLAALIFLPTILFGSNGQEGFLSRAQRAFLPTLPKFLFGVNDIGGLATNGDNFSASIEQSADEIATVTLSGFFAPPKELDEVCGPGTYEKTPPIKTLDDFSNNINLPCDKVGTGFIGLFATKYYKYSFTLQYVDGQTKTETVTKNVYIKVWPKPVISSLLTLYKNGTVITYNRKDTPSQDKTRYTVVSHIR